MKGKKPLFFIAIFILALIVHLIGLNLIGRTWDEQYKVDFGLIAWDRVTAGDFSTETWNEGADHPMVAKYIYGFLSGPEITLIKTVKEVSILSPAEVNAIINGNYIKTVIYDKLYAVSYDFTLARTLSAVFNSAAVLFTVILATYLMGDVLWAFFAGLFLLLTPRFVFLGQLVTFESISVFFFCLIILYFYKLLKSPTRTKYYVYVGTLCGLFFWTRYNNIIFLPFLAGWIPIHYLLTKDKKIPSAWKLLLIPAIAFILGIIIWPLMWHDFPKYLLGSFQFHAKRLSGFSFYYWKYLLLTTPLPILLGALVGILVSLKEKTYWGIVILWWVGCTIVLYTVSVIQLGATRYVVILYPAIAILCSYGYRFLLKKRYVLFLVPIFAFLMYEQIKVFPYYLDYYNQFAGGVNGAIAQGYEFSWWGEGQRETGLWINDNASDGSSVGLIVSPKYVFPKLRKELKFKEYVNEKDDADYIVVSHSELTHLSKKFFDSHSVVYEAKVDDEPLVAVLKKR